MKKNSVLRIRNGKKVLKNVFLVVLSIIGTLGVVETYKIATNNNALVNTPIPILLCLIEMFVYITMVRKHKKAERIFEILFALFVAILMVLGAELDSSSEIFWTFGTIVKSLSLAVFVFPFINITMQFLNRGEAKNLRVKNYKKLFLITFAIIFLGGLFIWLATFPGIWGYDAATQFTTIKNIDPEYTQSVGAHYSLPLGWLMTTIMSFGNSLFGSYQAGLALCSFLQMIFMTYVATRLVVYSTKKFQNVYLYIIAVIFFAVFPLYTSMTIYMTQDTVFAGLFALIFINTCEMVMDKQYWDKKRNPIILSVLILLMCLCRNNGFYCMLVAALIAIPAIKGKRLATAIVFLAPMLLFQIYNGPILDAAGIDKSSALREMLGIPSQQIARVYNYRSDLIDDETKKEIDKYYSNYKDFSEYRKYPSISDFTKRYINKRAVKDELGGYLKLWVSIGVRDIKDYIEAFLLNNLGFWYPNKSYPDDRMGIPYIEYNMTDRGDDRFLVIERESKIPFYDNWLNEVLVDDSFVDIPIVSSICGMGIYFILFCFLVGLTIMKKEWKLFVPIGIVIGLYFTLLLSPIALFRYCYPVVILWPVFFSMLFYKKR